MVSKIEALQIEVKELRKAEEELRRAKEEIREAIRFKETELKRLVLQKTFSSIRFS